MCFVCMLKMLAVEIEHMRTHHTHMSTINNVYTKCFVI